MTLPKLAPIPGRISSRTAPLARYVPTDNDWTIFSSELQRLYVHERRRLRYIMRYMEMNHGFKATEQMYKKRFAKWNLRKNCRQLPDSTSTPSSTTITSRTSSPVEDPGVVHVAPELDKWDLLLLDVLTNVKVLSASFYESVQFGGQASTSVRQTWSQQSQELNATFKLVFDVLNRGHGDLAGRLVRKAFLQVEDLLTIEGPALAWNILEIMHYMLMVRHWQLFHLLLAHLRALVNGRFPESHPLIAILRVLQVLAARLPYHGSSTLSSSTFMSFDEENGELANEASFISGTLLSTLERAWTLNAEIIFNHFDQRLFQLYLRIHWDACTLKPPTVINSAARSWLANSTLRTISSKNTYCTLPADVIQISPFEEDALLQRVFTTPINHSPPEDYDMLYASSIPILRDHAKIALDDTAGFAGNTVTLLRILAVLLTADVLEVQSLRTVSPNHDNIMISGVSQGQAGVVACAARTLMDLHIENTELETSYDMTKRIQSIVGLLNYSNEKTEPRIIQELWRLEIALAATGKAEKAMQVRQTAFRRLEQYIQDVPVSCA